MKKKFNDIKSLLSRDQMKQVRGGCGPNCTDTCTADSNCAGGSNNCHHCATGSILKGTCITSE